MDNALQQGLIPTEILGVSFAPARDYNDTSKCMKHDAELAFPSDGHIHLQMVRSHSAALMRLFTRAPSPTLP